MNLDVTLQFALTASISVSDQFVAGCSQAVRISR